MFQVEIEQVRLGLRSFVLERFLAGEAPESLKDSTALMTTGIISSLAMIELVAFLEQRFGVRLQHDDLTPDCLDSIDLIVDLVRRRPRLGTGES